MSGLAFIHLSASLALLVLGAMVFFAAIVTPVAFKTLEPEARGAYLGGLFPVYYRRLTVLSALAALLAITEPLGQVMIGVTAGFVFSDQVLRPRIAASRAGHLAGEPEATARFRAHHRASVYINLGQMAAIIAVLAFSAF